MLRGRQILFKDRGKDRIEGDSRKGAKGAKFGEVGKYFSLRPFGGVYPDKGRAQDRLGAKRRRSDKIGILQRCKGRQVLKRSVEHFIGKNLSHVTGADGLAGQ